MADRKLKIDIRRDQILRQLRQEGRVSVTRLSEMLGTTEVTIRNDLSALERDGFLMRVQGGAVPLPGRESSGLPDQELSHPSEKQAIASAVAKMIRDGDTLFINSGSTTACVAEALKSRKNLKIVTNSLAVATQLGDVSTLRVLLLGGEINVRYGFTYGSAAQEQLGRFQAAWAILSVDGISPAGGITTYHEEEAILDRMMIDAAERTLIAADGSKIGRAGFNRVCECGRKLTLVTNRCELNETVGQLQECGVQICYV